MHIIHINCTKANKNFDYVLLDKKRVNKYGTVQELSSTFSHIKSINIDFSLDWFVSLCGLVSLYVGQMVQKQIKKTEHNGCCANKNSAK